MRTLVDEAGIERVVEPTSRLANEFATCQNDVAQHFLGQLSQHCTMLGVAIVEVLTSLDRLDPELPFSGVVLARGLVEAAADLYWLSDPAIDAAERTRRTFLIYLRQHETNVRQLVQFSNRFPQPDDHLPNLDKAIDEGWASLKQTAEEMATAGYELRTSSRPGSKYSVGHPKPSISELVDTLIEDCLGKMTLNLYSLYSAVAHAEGEGLGSLCVPSDTVETAKGMRYRHGFDDAMWETRILRPTTQAAASACGAWVQLAHPLCGSKYRADIKEALR